MRALLEKLSAYIPGYTGYADRERRRETDQALRRAVAERLAGRKIAISRVIAEATRSMRLDALEPLENLRRRLDRLADVVRHAPAGYSSLFDTRELGAAELDRLTQHDDAIRQQVESLVVTIDAISLSEHSKLADIERALQALEDAVRRRDDLMRGNA